MNKVLIVAAIAAASVLPTGTVYAASPAAPKVSAECFFLPLLPDCLKQWKDESSATVAKVATAPKAAVAAPKLPAMPDCTKAAAGSGHLYDCKM